MIRAAGTTILPRRFKLCHYQLARILGNATHLNQTPGRW
jgi:hypothetical protein